MIFESDRQFQLWASWVGHGQVLLQSSQEGQPRIEILFKGTRALNLVSTIDGLLIRDATENEAAAAEEQTGVSLGRSYSAYMLEGNKGWTGFVIASSIHTAELAGKGVWEPSTLLIGPAGQSPADILDSV